MTKPLLVFTWGNPSRGDDALGPALHSRLLDLQARSPGLEHIEVLTDYQLQVEHVLDLVGRRWVLFVDAGVAVEPPFGCYRLAPDPALTFTTHAMSPSALLALYRQAQGQPPPPAFMLSVRGYSFDLGQPLSPRARHHLQAALDFVCTLTSDPPTDTAAARERCTST